VTDITSLLKAVDPGDPHAAAQFLLQLVSDDLRRLAHEAPGLITTNGNATVYVPRAGARP